MPRTKEVRLRGPVNVLREGIRGARLAHHPDMGGTAQRSGEPPARRYKRRAPCSPSGRGRCGAEVRRTSCAKV
ncbi:hypothetical protein GQY15_03505 [Rhodobacter sphaeroides]|nr:hypothetical protein [Cereibacter sphaeroides]